MHPHVSNEHLIISELEELHSAAFRNVLFSLTHKLIKCVSFILNELLVSINDPFHAFPELSHVAKILDISNAQLSIVTELVFVALMNTFP
jgi:hypothetical protein